MNSIRILLTGATGFIGRRLTKRLIHQGHNVTCIVRKPADHLAKLGVRLHVADLSNPDPPALRDQFDEVYHLAAATTSVGSRSMIRTNRMLTENLFAMLRGQDSLRRVLVVSSLAANGPSKGNTPTTECDLPSPVSNYGRSKLASEEVAREYIGQFPISIVRPPIVIGGGDANSFSLFKTVAKNRVHFVPGFRTRHYSLIHVDDLVTSLIAVARRGEVLDDSIVSRGLYYASADEIWTYAQIGKQIGKAIGFENVWTIPVGPTVIRLLAGMSEVIARIRGKQGIVNWDKSREALAGSWACSNAKLKKELQVHFPIRLQGRIGQTIRWYRDHGWLPPRQEKPQTQLAPFGKKQRN